MVLGLCTLEIIKTNQRATKIKASTPVVYSEYVLKVGDSGHISG